MKTRINHKTLNAFLYTATVILVTPILLLITLYYLISIDDGSSSLLAVFPGIGDAAGALVFFILPVIMVITAFPAALVILITLFLKHNLNKKSFAEASFQPNIQEKPSVGRQVLNGFEFCFKILLKTLLVAALLFVIYAAAQLFFEWLSMV